MELMDNDYNRPQRCSKCGGVMIFRGVGEYRCEDCKNVEYDDYGKARKYIEEHHGATAAEIEAAIGISQKAIRQMLKDCRLEVAPDSKTFLTCEFCGIPIRSGRFCPICDRKRLNLEEEEKRKNKNNLLKGTGMGKKSDEGAKRFTRE